jgi:hypothetical protein
MQFVRSVSTRPSYGVMGESGLYDKRAKGSNKSERHLSYNSGMHLIMTILQDITPLKGTQHVSLIFTSICLSGTES